MVEEAAITPVKQLAQYLRRLRHIGGNARRLTACEQFGAIQRFDDGTFGVSGRLTRAEPEEELKAIAGPAFSFRRKIAQRR
jgi:hypothetical protein